MSKDRALFNIDENTRIARDRLNFITQYRTKGKDGKYTNNWVSDRYFGNWKHLAEKVSLIDVRSSDAKDVKSLTEAINNMISKLDNMDNLMTEELDRLYKIEKGVR